MISTILDIVNKFIPDQDKANDLAKSLEAEYTKQMSMQHQIIMQESKNGSGKWRPRLMYLCMLMVSSQWIMYDVLPWCEQVFEWKQIIPTVAPMNAEMWSFLKLGVGGYIGSRGVENIALRLSNKFSKG